MRFSIPYPPDDLWHLNSVIFTEFMESQESYVLCSLYIGFCIFLILLINFQVICLNLIYACFLAR